VAAYFVCVPQTQEKTCTRTKAGCPSHPQSQKATQEGGFQMMEAGIMILVCVIVACVRHFIRIAIAYRQARSFVGDVAGRVQKDAQLHHPTREETSMFQRDGSLAVHVVSDQLLEHGAWETIQNRAELAESHICACFHCQTHFFPEEIKVWRDARTAVCPHCGKSAVVPDASHLPLTAEFLARMKARYGRMV
jgi:hypothetical protein